MTDLIDDFLTWKEINQGKSAQTVVKYRLYLQRLEAFCSQAGIELYEATLEHLEVFSGPYVFKEMSMGPDARRSLVAAVRGFYQWLQKSGRTRNNPAASLEYPKAPKKLPMAMPIDAAEKLMWAPDLTEFTGIRDAAMLGLLIGCGIRITGLVRLNTSSLVWSSSDGREQLTIRVHEKGDKQRLVPVPEQARLLLRAYQGHEYLERVNRRIDLSDQVLFISTRNRLVSASELYGEALRISTNSVRKMIVRYGEKAGIPREYLHPHALRHLYGAELTEDDVDVLDRMGLMGHQDVKSAEIYSHIAQRKFRKIVDKSSPLSKMRTPVSDLARLLQQEKP